MKGLTAMLAEIAKTKSTAKSVRNKPVCGPAVRPKSVSLSSAKLSNVDTSEDDFSRPSSSRLRLSPEGLVLPPLHAPPPPPKLTEETAMSFEEWKAWGAWVMKGSKSYIRDALNIPQFTKEQVSPPRGKTFPKH